MFSCFVLCDISKAFDRVWCKGLLSKLRQNGIDGKLFEFLNSYLSQIKQKVCLNHVSGLQLSLLPCHKSTIFRTSSSFSKKNLLSSTRLFEDDNFLFNATKIYEIACTFNYNIPSIFVDSHNP